MGIYDAVILAGGVGKRFRSTFDGVGGECTPKQFQKIGQYPVFIYALKALLRLNTFRQIVLVFPKEHLGAAKEQLDAHLSVSEVPLVRLVAGGKRRQDSARLGVEALADLGKAPDRVIIHDACRPFLSPAFLSRMNECLSDRTLGAWIPAVPVSETLKRVSHYRVEETVSRADLYRVQTPQIFEYGLIRRLHQKCARDTAEYTDDASLCEREGVPIGVFHGDERNIKLTYPFEMEILRPLLAQVGASGGAECELELDTIYTD